MKILKHAQISSLRTATHCQYRQAAWRYDENDRKYLLRIIQGRPQGREGGGKDPSPKPKNCWRKMRLFSRAV